MPEAEEMHNTVKRAKETAPGRGRHACDQAPQPCQAGSLAAVTLIRSARCQSRLLLHPDDLHSPAAAGADILG